MGEHWLIPSFNFMLRVDGAFDIPLKSVQPFSRDNEYEPIQEGGMNDYVYLKRKPITQPFKLVIERYVNYNLSIADPLSNGTELLLPLLLFVGNNTGGSQTYSRYYTFTGAVVMGKQYGGLDAEKSGLLTETITFGYNHMFCTTLPLSEDVTDPAWKLESKTGGKGKLYASKGRNLDNNTVKEAEMAEKAALWQFDDKKVDGKGKKSQKPLPGSVDENGKKIENKPEQRKYIFGLENNENYQKAEGETSTRSAKVLPKSTGKEGEKAGSVELTRGQMIEKAQRFEWDEGGLYTGNGVRKARHHDDLMEKHTQTMVENAKEWKFDKKTKAGAGTRSSQNYKELPDGSSTGLGRAEDTQTTMEGRAAKGVKITDNGTDGNKGIAPRRWNFDDKAPATKDGKGDRSRQNAVADKNGEVESGIGVSEASKEEMINARKKWAFARDKYVKEGNKVQSAVKAEGVVEEDAKSMAQKAKKWDFDEKKKEGDGERSRQNAVAEGNGADGATGLGVTELDRDSMIKGAKKWVFSNDPNGNENTTSHVKPTDPELSRDTMIGKAKKAKTKPDKSPKPEPRTWKFDDKEPATKTGQGTASRVTPRAEELTKDQMAGKAVKHVKQSITDFLMG